MQALVHIDPVEFQRALTSQVMLPLQVIHGAVAGSVIVFAAAVVFVASTTTPPADPQSVASLDLLMMIHGLVAVGCYLSARMIFDRQLRKTYEPSSVQTGTGVSPEEGAAHALQLLRTAVIIRLALIEAPAVIGLVICLVAALQGVLTDYPRYWINAVPAIILIFFVAATFPTSDRLTSIMQKRIRDH